MAICNLCKGEMTSVSTCTGTHLRFEPFDKAQKPQEFKRIKYHYEARYGNLMTHGGEKDRCHDCGVSPNALHHPGCDVEECPICHGQLISCICNESGLFSDVIYPRDLHAFMQSLKPGQRAVTKDGDTYSKHAPIPINDLPVLVPGANPPIPPRKK
jgi:hypothetical protein